MSLRYSFCTIQTGTLGEGEHFSTSGNQGDWQEFSANFSETLPSSLPRVFITPFLDSSFHRGAVPVCIVTAVSSKGFNVAARNISNSAGETAFTWVAVCDTSANDLTGAPLTNVVPGLRSGVVPPRWFAPAGASGDFQSWPTPSQVVLGAEVDPFSITQSSVLVAPTNLNVTTNNAAVVGLVDRPSFDGLAELTARNSDLSGGECAFYWSAFDQISPFDVSKREPSIETGAAFASFEPNGRPGDWQYRDIFFVDSFLTSPVILLCGLMDKQRVAVVGVAQDVTPYGFTLAMRNADIIGGIAGCSWMAIGWPVN